MCNFENFSPRFPVTVRIGIVWRYHQNVSFLDPNHTTNLLIICFESNELFEVTKVKLQISVVTFNYPKDNYLEIVLVLDILQLEF